MGSLYLNPGKCKTGFYGIKCPCKIPVIDVEDGKLLNLLMKNKPEECFKV